MRPTAPGRCTSCREFSAELSFVPHWPRLTRQVGYLCPLCLEGFNKEAE